jgi:outer membrane protein TolC
MITHFLFAVCLAIGAVLLPAGLALAAATNPAGPATLKSPPDDALRIYAPTGAIGAVVNAGAIEASIQDAVLMSLENNRGLAVQRLTPSIVRTREAEERAVFDPVFDANLSREQTIYRQPTSSNVWSQNIRANATVGELTLGAFLPTGTRLTLDALSDLMDTDSSGSKQDYDTTRGGVSVTQSLLRGGSISANLASLRQARLDTRISEYNLRGYAEALVAQVETRCWDYILALQQIDIFTNSLALAQQQLREIKERIEVGKLAAVEQYAAEAEVAVRQEGLIQARSLYETTRLQVLRLLNPPGAGLWNRALSLKNKPSADIIDPDSVEDHVQVALRWRPDLNEARLAMQRGDLEVVKTRNGLLPKLDLFITLGKTGYAYSFGDSVRNVGQEPYDALAGLSFEYPLGNRDAEAKYRRARLSREQADEALANLTQLVEVDVRTAFIEVQRARQQIFATAATTKAQEETVKAEQEKFKVGKSTSLLLTTAERNLLASRIEEVRAMVAYLKALSNLYLMDGSLLVRRGISAPGGAPAE